MLSRDWVQGSRLDAHVPTEPPCQCLLIKDIKVTLSLSFSGGAAGCGVWGEVSVRGAVGLGWRSPQ